MSRGHLMHPAVVRVGLTLLVTASLLGTSASAQEAPKRRPAQPAVERAAALLGPAVVYVETFWAGSVYDEDGEYFNDGNPYEFSTSCTGFVVNPAGTIVTAGHCVDDTASFGGIQRDLIGRAAREAFDEGTYEGDPTLEKLSEFGLANWTTEGPSKGKPVKREVFVQARQAVSGERSGDALPAKVVDFRSAESGDVAVLTVEAGDLPSVMVSEADELKIGTPLVLVGYGGTTDAEAGETLEPDFEHGRIVARKTQGSHTVYEVSAAIAKGMSGGPTGDMEGAVIGLNGFGVGDSDAFNFIVPASDVRDILAKNGIENELGRIDTIYREGLTALYADRFAAAIAAFDRVLDLDPDHREAQLFRNAAVDQRTSRGEQSDSSFPIVPVAAGAVLILGLIGAATAVRGRRPQREAPSPDAEF